jgi:hypothetical protein
MTMLTNRELDFLAGLRTSWTRLYCRELERLLQEDSDPEESGLRVSQTNFHRHCELREAIQQSQRKPGLLRRIRLCPKAGFGDERSPRDEGVGVAALAPHRTANGD